MTEGKKASNDDLRDMLERFRKEIISYYPFTEENSEDDIDSRYCITMGFIVGNVTECLAAVTEDRPIRLAATGFKEVVLMYGDMYGEALGGNAREGNEE